MKHLRVFWNGVLLLLARAVVFLFELSGKTTVTFTAHGYVREEIPKSYLRKNKAIGKDSVIAYEKGDHYHATLYLFFSYKTFAARDAEQIRKTFRVTKVPKNVPPGCVLLGGEVIRL